jgi:hypothetical protein
MLEFKATLLESQHSLKNPAPFLKILSKTGVLFEFRNYFKITTKNHLFRLL